MFGKMLMLLLIYLMYKDQQLLNILIIYIITKNLKRIQLVPFWNKLNLKAIGELLEKENIIILI